MKRVAITGPTGTIGIALIQNCIAKQIEVLAICRHNSQRIQDIPKSPLVKIIECDLAEYKTYCALEEKKYDVFFHLAWNGTFGDSRNNMELQIKNIEYTLDAVYLAQRLGCYVFVGAGSQAEYGRVDKLLTSSTPINPENGYGMAKLCAGSMSRYLCQNMGIHHIWARILSVYGPYDGLDTMIMSTITKLIQNKPTHFTSGEQLWDYLYSKDAAQALLLLAENGIDGKTYCVAGGTTRPLKEYINIIYTLIGACGSLGIGDIPYSTKQVMYLGADITELQKDTGFSPQYSFEEGIRETISWYCDKRGKL